MRAPPAYLDECMDAPLIGALRQRGYDLLTAREAATLRATDEGQLAYAARIRRPIISYNRIDFLRARAIPGAGTRTSGNLAVAPETAAAGAGFCDWR
jgi:hypothetical protein